MPVAPTEESHPPLPVDAVVHISISSDIMSAYLCIDPPMNGGIPPTLAILVDAIASSKITYGVNTAKLKELAENPIYNENIKIAQGIMPQNGVDGTYAFQFRVNRDPKPKINPDGTVDYRDLGIVENVSKEQVLCVITHPTDGTEGMTVIGKKLFSVKGKAVPSLLGKNTELSQDGTAIYSQIDGQVEFYGGKINVNETFFIQGDVDNSTGNVKVVGNVVIKGEVLPQFVVEASGDIEIYGTVVSAGLKADGNIILRSGIISSELRCKGDLTSRFIENCNVSVIGSITADYIINCNIECGQSLQLIGSKGKIFGGNCVVGQDIVARVIGSEAWVKTNLNLDTIPTVAKRLQELTQLLPGLEKQLESLKSLVSLLQQQESTNHLLPQNKRMLDKAIFSYETCVKAYKNSKQELAEINESLKTKGYRKITCLGIVFPGTNIRIGTAKLSVVDKMTSTSFYYSDGKICQHPIQ